MANSYDARYAHTRRLVKARSQTRTAVLGDETDNIYSDRLGYYFARPVLGADENGNALLGATFYLRANPAAGILPNPGRKVLYGTDKRGIVTITGPDLNDLQEAGIDARALEPNDTARGFISLWQIVNLASYSISTDLLVNVYPWQYQTSDNIVHFFPGTNAATQVDLTDSVPTDVDTHRYTLLVFNVTQHLLSNNPLELYDGTAVSLFPPTLTLTINDDLQTCYDLLPTDEIIIPIKAYYLEYGQTSIAGASKDIDVRQFINLPFTIQGFTVAASSGTNPVIGDGQTLNIVGSGGIATSGNSGTKTITIDGSGISSGSFTVAGDSGTPQTISSGNTLLISGGTGLSSVASATDTLTVNLDNTAVTPGSYTYMSGTVDAQGRLTAASSGAAPGTMSSFTVAGDSGSSQTISNADTLTLIGGGGIDTAASATDNLTIAVDSTVIRTTGTQAIAAGLTITSPVINTGVSGTAIDTDPTLAANSDTLLASQKATRSYVDQAILGLSAKADVRLVTTAALPTLIYANGSSGVGATLTAVSVGVLTIDGVAVALNDRLLIKDQAAGLQNGIYRCTVAGALGVAFVLTRTPDADTDAEIRGCWLFSTEGTINADQGWLNTNTSAITFGTTAITFGEFSAGAIAAGDGLTKTGNTIAVNNTVIRTTGTQAIAAGLTVTAPTIADFTNMQHDHLDADDGGTLTPATFGVQTANTILAGPTTGSAANATFRASVLADLPTQIGRVQWDYFSASGTYTLPANALWLRVILTSGGSGGGGGRRGAASTIRGGGGGGSGGATVMADFYAGQIGTPGVTTKTVTIGTGGAGGTKAAGDNLNGNPGSGGNASFFGGTTISNSLLCASLPDTGSNGGAQGAAGAAAGGAGNTVLRSNFQYYGSAGGTGGNGSGAIGGQFAAFGPGAGGGGAGIATGGGIDTPGSGSQGSGRVAGFPPTGAGGLGAGAGANGAASTTDGTSPQIFGSGGGGGGGSVSGAAQAGGNGSEPGGGGGGGGASLNGNASGDGGNGATGGCLIMTLCVR